MSRFNVNTLPAEFEAEHGTTSLEDVKPHVDVDGGEDEDLDLAKAGQRVWLVKVPKFLHERWSEESRQAGQVLGKVRVYDEKDNKGNPKISVLLDNAHEEAARKLPSEYKLTLQNTVSKNLFVFGEREEEDASTGPEGHRRKRRKTALAGTVNHECSLTPNLASAEASLAYRNIMRNRQEKATKPTRTVQMLDVDRATQNRMASGFGAGFRGRMTDLVKSKTAGEKAVETRSIKLPRHELLDTLFRLFSSAPYWSMKAIMEHVKQPQSYLREVLNEIALTVPKGPYAGLYRLKEEFKSDQPAEADRQQQQAQQRDEKPLPAELEADDDDDPDMEVIA